MFVFFPGFAYVLEPKGILVILGFPYSTFTMNNQLVFLCSLFVSIWRVSRGSFASQGSDSFSQGIGTLASEDESPIVI